MRLTLRTLLAWMDDKLPPNEVREISRQMKESPFARDLVAKINKVARQRRLTVPGDSGPDGVDPNLVAAYLDNELAPEILADYEKRCLTSDVHLAEVASVHQVLSLIGQKAKVPPEARHRMYRLIKGREAGLSKSAITFAKSASEPREKLSVAPGVGWSDTSVPRKTFAERFGLGAAVLGLMGILIFTAVKSLDTSDGPRGVRPQPVPDGQPALDGDAQVVAVGPDRPAPVEPTKPVTAPETEKAEEKAATVSVADAAAIKIEKSDGILLVRSSPDAAWKPADPKVGLKVGDQLLNMTPNWAALRSGQVGVTLVGLAQISVVPGEGGKGSRLKIDLGKVILKDIPKESPFEVSFRDRPLQISTKGATPVGLEILPARLAGAAEVPPPSLHVTIPDGEATMHWGSHTAPLSGASGLSILPTDQFAEPTKSAAPPWVTDSAPSAFDVQLSERFAKTIRPNRPILASLVEAREDEDKEIRRLSIAALGALGSAEMLVPILNESNDPSTRKAAVEALKLLLSRDAETRRAVRGELEKSFGEGAEITEKLLVGFTPAEAKEEVTLSRLVGLLTAPDLGTRALAIDSLKALTGRDNMEYDPMQPEGRGLNAWKELVVKKELRKGERVPPAPQPR